MSVDTEPSPAVVILLEAIASNEDQAASAQRDADKLRERAAEEQAVADECRAYAASCRAALVTLGHDA